MNSKFWFFRFQQVLIAVIHLILLWWIIYVLQNAGVMKFRVVFFHFLGMSIYGGLLIRSTAYWAKYHHEKEAKEN